MMEVLELVFSVCMCVRLCVYICVCVFACGCSMVPADDTTKTGNRDVQTFGKSIEKHLVMAKNSMIEVTAQPTPAPIFFLLSSKFAV